MEQVAVNTPSGNYKIRIGTNLWAEIMKFAQNYEKAYVITDSNVQNLYGSKLSLPTFALEPGEESKDLKIVSKLSENLANANMGRNHLIIALGGGVVGDIAGFTASIYQRGIHYLQIPTTLLAMVDSSVGGKTGVNLPQGKNLLGTFYQPQGVFISLETLATLPKREIITGLAEIFKYGVIWDSDLFFLVSSNLKNLEAGDLALLKPIISRCCQIKGEVVAQDELDRGKRKILNHGHTMGHALETLTNYQSFTHGEAVLLGMLLEARLSRELGLLTREEYHLLKTSLQEVDFHWHLPHFSKAQFLQALLQDKKNRDGKVSFILPTQIGSVQEVLLTTLELENYLERILVK